MVSMISTAGPSGITPADTFLPDFVLAGPDAHDPDGDDPDPLPPAPVGALQLWAHGPAGPEVPFKRVQMNVTPRTVRMARTFARGSAGVLAGHPLYAGGKVRVVDGRGNVWHREPIPAAEVAPAARRRAA